MEFNEVAVTRKSIRKYAARPVAKEDIEAMLRCAMEAPSWKNSQTARYHVITSSTMLQAMKQEGLAPFNAENTKDAPVLIVTSFVKDVAALIRTVPRAMSSEICGVPMIWACIMKIFY